ncbi:DUF1737 domain-containing protein [Actinoplanes bogorensis]|uniref:DUF1737 domain-containing protein n=1 Tax=Paractinoplanes bogorensis TaxID=1610840 RepID=A0ABS5YGM5_9ACTN|nr:DUF1737 domain-containing protein [Actinoplanes bogorensis]MBU2662530.1 DUF1737 domain-containing protein [Actinoplanes bogorensis]
MTELAQRLRYRLITGPDDAEFCGRVSDLVEQGYRLHGSPALTFDGRQVIAAQALVLPDPAGGAG